MSEVKRSSIDLLKGHMPFGLHRFLPRSAQYFTMLRDPVERVISQYFYIRNNKNNPLHEALVSADMSPADLVESGISVGLNNGQTRWLLGDLQAIEFGGVNASHLQAAKENLDRHFITIGINEMFDQSVLMLAHSLSWKRLPYYCSENTNRKKTTVSDSDIVAIRKYNEHDIALYEYAVARLNTEIDSVPDFDNRLEKFRSRNELYSSLIKPMRVLKLIR